MSTTFITLTQPGTCQIGRNGQVAQSTFNAGHETDSQAIFQLATGAGLVNEEPGVSPGTTFHTITVLIQDPFINLPGRALPFISVVKKKISTTL